MDTRNRVVGLALMASVQAHRRIMAGMDDDSPLRILLTEDGRQRTMDFWLRFAGVANADELARVLDNMINVGIVISTEFERRFPAEYAAYEKEQDLR